MGPHPERIACVRDAGKKKTRSATCPAQPRLKSQGAKLSFFERFCALGTRRGFCPAGFLPAAGNRSQARARTRNQPRACAAQMQTQTRCASCSAQPRVRARRGEEKGTERELPTAGAHLERIACLRGLEKTQTGCVFCSPQVRVRARLGKGTNPVRDLLTAGAPQARDFCLLRKTEARRGPAPGTSRVRARLGKDTNRVRVLLTAGVRACETRGRKRHGARIARRRRANCSPQVRRCAGELGKGEL